MYVFYLQAVSHKEEKKEEPLFLKYGLLLMVTKVLENFVPNFFIFDQCDKQGN